MPKLALAFDVLANDKGATRTLDNVAAHSEKTGRRISKSFGVLAGSITGAFAGIGAVKLFGDFNAEAREAQRDGRLTAQVLKTTGRAAHVTQKQVEGLANAISVKAGIDDEAVQSAENLLLTFTGVRNEVGKNNKIFNRATQIVVDMSTALGQDLKSSSIQVGKALNDPIKGVTALQRVGVSFTASQKKQIKTLVDSGRTLDAQKVILRELGREFGGAAEAAATPVDRLHVKIKNIEEAIGTKLLPIEDKAANFLLNKGIPAIEQFASEFQHGTGTGGKFADAVHEVGDGLEHAWHVGKPLLSFIADHPKLFTEIAVGAGGFATAMKAMGAVKKLPGLGSLASKAAPLPVFVTNEGFGGGGVPGSRGPGSPIIAAGGKVGVAGRARGALNSAPGQLVVTVADTVLVPEAVKSLKKLYGTRFDISVKGAADRFLAQLEDVDTDKVTRRILQKHSDAVFAAVIQATKTGDTKGLQKALTDTYGDLAKHAGSIHKEITHETAVNTANNVKLISGGFLTIADLANKTSSNAGKALTTNITSGARNGARALEHLNGDLDHIGTRKPTPVVGTQSITGATKKTTELYGWLSHLEGKNPKPTVTVHGLLPAIAQAGSLLHVLNKLDGKRVTSYAQLVASLGRQVIAADRTDTTHRAAGGGMDPWKVYTVGERGREKVVVPNGGYTLTHQDAMRAASGNGGTTVTFTGDIVVPDTRTALSVPDQMRQKLFTAGL